LTPESLRFAGQARRGVAPTRPSGVALVQSDLRDPAAPRQVVAKLGEQFGNVDADADAAVALTSAGAA
jgi:hypothetical protein